jgi:hypothetical protein
VHCSDFEDLPLAFAQMYGSRSGCAVENLETKGSNWRSPRGKGRQLRPRACRAGDSRLADAVGVGLGSTSSTRGKAAKQGAPEEVEF